MNDLVTITLQVNGRTQRRTVEPRMLLSDFLRHELGLTGTHVGCEHGICGACTVLLDGDSARSCLTLAAMAEGMEITTVEALGDVDNLNLLQRKFREHHALQCGFCTPGMLMTASDILSRGRMLSDAQTMIYTHPMLAVRPGLAIVLMGLGRNLMGDGVRDMPDPRLRRVRQ